MAYQKTIIIKAGVTSITLPPDWNPNDFQAHVWAPGGNGFNASGLSAGGGGSAWASSKNLSAWLPSATLYCSLPVGGTQAVAWLNTTNTNPSSNTTGVRSDYGRPGGNSTPGVGGQTANCIYNFLARKGGDGGDATNNNCMGGGGGAGGPDGDGQNGGQGGPSVGAGNNGACGGGGAANGGSPGGNAAASGVDG